MHVEIRRTGKARQGLYGPGRVTGQTDWGTGNQRQALAAVSIAAVTPDSENL